MSEPSPLLKPLAPATTAARLWKNGKFITDIWRLTADDAPFPIDGRAILTLAHWRHEQAAILATGLAVGVLVQVNETLDSQTDNLERLHVITLNFPKFTDGRAYSTARRLREEYGYTGELRATGDVLIDQLPLMLRSGFDAFEIVNEPTIAALERGAIPAVSRVYQRNVTRDAGRWQPRAGVKA